MQDALGSGLPEHDPYQAEPVVKLADAVYRKHAENVERGHFDSLLVSELLVLAARDHRQSGDDAVLLAGALGTGYLPDVEGLLEAWRRCDKHDDVTRNQIAWAACRAPLSQLLERLAPEIAKEPETLARFIGAAASWAETGEPPLTPAGDEPKAPEPGAPTELINDMLMAAPPPDMATANGPPEPVAANGGAEAEAPAAAEPRWILVWVADAAEPEQPLQVAFRAGAVHEIAVAIGPNQEGAIAAVGGRPFDEELGEVADMEELTVTFLAPSISIQQSESIFLPRTGTSRRATFAVKLPPEPGRFDAEIRVHHRNRVVQMARLSGLVAPDPADVPPGSRIVLEVATIVPETVDLGTRAGADAGIVQDRRRYHGSRRNGSPRLRRRPARSRRPGRRVAQGPHRSRDERRLAAAEARGCRRRPARARLPRLRALSGDRRAARRDPRQPAARPAAGTRRRAQRLLSTRARLRPAGADEGGEALPRLEDGAANGRVPGEARGGRRAAPPRDVLPERLLGAVEGDRAQSRRDWQLAPSRCARGLRDRRPPRSDHRARHARAAARRCSSPPAARSTR